MNEVHELTIGDILVSYDVSSLLMNVPLEETIQLLTNKAFIDNWFDETQHLNPNELILVDLVRVAAKDQLFLFNSHLYGQTDRVTMSCPLGPLLANFYMHICIFIVTFLLFTWKWPKVGWNVMFYSSFFLFQMFYEIIYCVFTFMVGSNSNQTQKITSYC